MPRRPGTSSAVRFGSADDSLPLVGAALSVAAPDELIESTQLINNF